MRKTTSSVVMKNCNEYLAYENLGQIAVGHAACWAGRVRRLDPKRYPKTRHSRS